MEKEFDFISINSGSDAIIKLQSTSKLIRIQNIVSGNGEISLKLKLTYKCYNFGDTTEDFSTSTIEIGLADIRIFSTFVKSDCVSFAPMKLEFINEGLDIISIYYRIE